MATPTFAPIPQYNLPNVSPVTPFKPPTLPDLPNYTAPTFNFGAIDPSKMVSDPLEANIKAAPSLEKIADIINSINQKAWWAAPGRQQQFETLQRWQAGELDPEIYEQERLDAAQRFGSAGFGVDSPAWQSSIRRALGLKRQELEEKGMAGMSAFYGDYPKPADITPYTMSAKDYADAMDAARQRQLGEANLQQEAILRLADMARQRDTSLAEMAQRGEITTAQLAQQREISDREMAQKQAELTEQGRRQQEELAERARAQTQKEAADIALEEARARAQAEQAQASQFAELFGKYYTPTRFSGVGYDPRTTEGRRMQDYFYGQDALARQRALRAATMATGYYSPSMFQSGAYPTMRALS